MTIAKIEAVNNALIELASTPIHISLQDWSRIYETILDAMKPDAPTTAQQSAIDALAELACVSMDISLQDWSRLSGTIIAAI